MADLGDLLREPEVIAASLATGTAFLNWSHGRQINPIIREAKDLLGANTESLRTVSDSFATMLEHQTSGSQEALRFVTKTAEIYGEMVNESSKELRKAAKELRKQLRDLRSDDD